MTSQTPEAELRLIGDIYDAALDPGLWPAVIRGIAAFAGAEKANILAFDKLNPDYFLFHSHGICQAFLRQPSLEAVAESCGLSLATVRSYLKSIYEKTGQHSQAELMHLLMSLRLNFEHIA